MCYSLVHLRALKLLLWDNLLLDNLLLLDLLYPLHLP